MPGDLDVVGRQLGVDNTQLRHMVAPIFCVPIRTVLMLP